MKHPAAGNELDTVAEPVRQLVVHGTMSRKEVQEAMRELTEDRIATLVSWATQMPETAPPTLTPVEAALVMGMQELSHQSHEASVQIGMKLAMTAEGVKRCILDGGVFVGVDTSEEKL